MLARAHLLSVRSEVAQLQTAITAGQLDGLTGRLVQIRGEAHAARELTSDPVWAALSRLPWLGSTLDAANQVATSVDQVASQVLPPLVNATDMIQPRTLRQPDGRLKLARLPAAIPICASQVPRSCPPATGCGRPPLAGSSRPSQMRSRHWLVPSTDSPGASTLPIALRG